MMRVMTSSIARDRDMAMRLREQLYRHNIEHYIFVEQGCWNTFKNDEDVFIKPDNGTNGLGRSGSVVRQPCYQRCMEGMADTDTLGQIDSDVLFMDESMIADLYCGPGETVGYGSDVHTVDGRSFSHCSGMMIFADVATFRKAYPKTPKDMYDVCTRMDEQGICCSEDVSLSYILQGLGGAKLRNLHGKWNRGDGMPGPRHVKY
jgi:hypothetical protein